MKFNELKLEKNILKALKEAGYSEPTPIQQQAIPPVLEGRDLMGCAQTGTGKTCAFSVPIIQRLAKSEGGKGTIRALILTPTRELALQIYENVCQYARYMPCSAAVIFGGVSQVPQVEAIERGVDILIATPGRLWDLMGQKIVKLDKAEFFVLDEADRMLDMGFFPDVKRIVKFLPKKRQTLLFSATIPAEIADLAEKMLHEPEHISVTPSAKPADKIEQQLYFVEKQEKRELLPDIIRQSNVHQVLVFTRTKHGADRVARDLTRAGIKTKSIHGDKSQNQRQRALADFKECKIAVLVATDIAARGIDINDLPLVINFDLPNIPETYVHRIGRTGRAGQEGTAISFCDRSERPYLKASAFRLPVRFRTRKRRRRSASPVSARPRTSAPAASRSPRTPPLRRSPQMWPAKRKPRRRRVRRERMPSVRPAVRRPPSSRPSSRRRQPRRAPTRAETTEMIRDAEAAAAIRTPASRRTSRA